MNHKAWRVGVWHERNFRLLFIGQTVSSFGNTLTPVALAFAVLDLTGSASNLGDVLGAGATALLVFLLIGGVMADRMPRRTLMVGADAVRGGAQLALGLLLLTGHPSVATLAGLSATIGMATAVFMPASTGLLPSLVKKEYLQQANALQQTSSAAAGIAGPAAAGISVATVGPGWAIVADAGTFFVSVAMLSLVRLQGVPRAVSQNWLRDLHDGWKDFWARDWFRDIVLGASVFNLLFATYMVLGPVASRRYYGGVEAWATVATAAAIGSVVGGLIAVRLRPRHPLRLAVAVAALASLAPLAFAGLLPVAVIAVAAALGGGGIIFFQSLWETSVQRHVPEQMLSRASSYDWSGSLIAYPIGLAIAGPVAAAAGPRLVLLGVGGLDMILLAVLFLLPSVRSLSDETSAPTHDAPSAATAPPT
jgi:MFS family permease